MVYLFKIRVIQDCKSVMKIRLRQNLETEKVRLKIHKCSKGIILTASSSEQGEEDLWNCLMCWSGDFNWWLSETRIWCHVVTTCYGGDTARRSRGRGLLTAVADHC